MTKIDIETMYFIEATAKERRDIMSQMKRRGDVEALLQKVATAADIHRRGITQHPYLQRAHKQLKALKKRLRSKAELMMQISFLRRDLHIINEDNVRLRYQLAQAEQGTKALRQEFSDEMLVYINKARQIEDEMNRLLQENEELQGTIDAALTARDKYGLLVKVVADLAEANANALLADVKLAKRGVKFSDI